LYNTRIIGFPFAPRPAVLREFESESESMSETDMLMLPRMSAAAAERAREQGLHAARCWSRMSMMHDPDATAICTLPIAPMMASSPSPYRAPARLPAYHIQT
jgi:hypothetical protein